MPDPPPIALQPYTLADAADLFEAVRESRATVGSWAGWDSSDFTPEVARAWIEGRMEAFRAGAGFDFAIRSDQGRFLGSCALSGLDPGNGRANLGYWVRATETGKGVATGAVRLLVRWAFRHTDLHRLEIVAAEGNAASLRVAEKLGAVREGVLRQRLRQGGRLLDAVQFAILRPGPRVP